MGSVPEPEGREVILGVDSGATSTVCVCMRRFPFTDQLPDPITILAQTSAGCSNYNSVRGNGEGGIEMTESMRLIREFCDLFFTPEKVARTRIASDHLKNVLLGFEFFPEAKEVQFARKKVFGGVSHKLDYLTKPSFFEDFGLVQKVKMADRVKPEDEVFLVPYPHFNVNEMLVVEELYKEAVVSTPRKLIIFNGELDRIRSGSYRTLESVEENKKGIYLFATAGIDAIPQGSVIN